MPRRKSTKAPLPEEVHAPRRSTRLSEKAGETQREEQKQTQQRREAKERRERVEKDDFDPWADEELKQLSADEAYLSYYDVRLTKEDMYTLKNDWLTDNVIQFWEEYLEREVLVHYPNSNIVLLRPSMSQLLKLTPDPTTIASALGDFRRTTHIFLPVNDNTSPSESEAGTHWSLLLVSIVDGVAFHYDSLPPGNTRDAQHLTNKISQLLKTKQPLRFIELEDSPTQENSMDCGVFVCYVMRHLLLKRLLMVKSDQKVNMSMGGRSVDAREVRREIAKIIDGYRKEGVRRS